MKGGNSNVLRGKRFPLSLIIICTTLLIWRWERSPLITTFLPPHETHDATPSVFRTEKLPSHQHPSEEEDFPDAGPLGSSLTEREVKVHRVPLKESSTKSFIVKIKKDKNSIRLPLKKKGCNYGKGKWVADDRRPLYSGFGCKQWLSDSWSCRLTQRKDFSYEKFRWQPESCDMPEFQGSTFLTRMQDKTIAIVGDSLGRQQYQSLMCMVTGGKEAPEVEDIGREYGFETAPGSKRPNGWAYRFPRTNTTILYYWSATLCELEPLNQSDPDTRYAMHLDRPASFIKQFIHRFDALVLNTGHHWNRGKLNANRWEMYVDGKPNADPKVAFIWNAKSLTIKSVVRWLDAQLPRHPRLKAFFTTISPRHFFNGDWNSGGSCDNTNPLAGGSVVSQDGSSDVDVEAAANGTGVRVLDITALSQLRDEGHISRYSIQGTPGVQDCLHWCLPGVPDTWNEILSAQL